MSSVTLKDAVLSGEPPSASQPELLVWPLDRQRSTRCARSAAARSPFAAEFCASMKRSVVQSVCQRNGVTAAKDITKTQNERQQCQDHPLQSYNTVVGARVAWRHERSHVLLTVHSCRPSSQMCHAAIISIKVFLCFMLCMSLEMPTCHFHREMLRPPLCVYTTCFDILPTSVCD